MTTVFTELHTQYPTWPALRDFLLSDDGGRLRVIEDISNTFAIVRYVKGTSDFTKSHVSAFRSVVWNVQTHRPVSFAPFKAQKGDPLTGVQLRITDFIDGVMIQAWSTGSAEVKIATRTSIGATGTFYSQRSFADLLEDALKPMGGTTAFLKSVLHPGQCVSLVLQHPEHKTVAVIPTPRVYATHFNTIAADCSVTFNYDPATWPQRLAAIAPTLYEPCKVFVNSDEATTLLHQSSLGHAWQGLVFQDLMSARRWRLRNPAYVAVRNLRGAEANQTARFLRLRKEGKMKEYIGFYREESPIFWALEQRLRTRTQALYDSYTRLHKAKTVSMRDLPLVFRSHVYALHGQYMAKFTEDQRPPPVLKETVIAYVNSLPQEEQVRLLDAPLLVPGPPQRAPVAVAH
jgi:hypothetical protein